MGGPINLPDRPLDILDERPDQVRGLLDETPGEHRQFVSVLVKPVTVDAIVPQHDRSKQCGFVGCEVEDADAERDIVEHINLGKVADRLFRPATDFAILL
ncbi:hypothetical protein [Novosphingobium sp. B1]|uniref:hypothetical protein n=1 Tax=Novosphingobium sp. B1 TaxID=1938756 RepID=UPI0015942025|nr:hypothetical protein [Novosphingobium sp. B1]